ncbi:MAG: hypothetical protein D6689_14455, partial [Deltaproteobacteria bacterium]
ADRLIPAVVEAWISAVLVGAWIVAAGLRERSVRARIGAAVALAVTAIAGHVVWCGVEFAAVPELGGAAWPCAAVIGVGLPLAVAAIVGAIAWLSLSRRGIRAGL